MNEQLLVSEAHSLRAVVFPEYRGRQLKYYTFPLLDPRMPKGFEDYELMVRQLCTLAGAHDGDATITVDEKLVYAGESQRRPKPHVDGCYRPEAQRWGGGSGWLHYCNDVGASPIGRMAVIVAASKVGCKVFPGTFKGRPSHDGDLSHIQDQLGKGEVLPANMGYLLSPSCVHESMLMESNTIRQFVRIALPVAYAEARWK